MITAINNRERRRYEMVIDGSTAYVTYAEAAGEVTLIHTLVPPAFEGRGVGSALIRSVLEDLRLRGMKVVPACGFVAAFMERHPEFGDLRTDGRPGQAS